MDKDIIPQYNITKQNYTTKEKELLGEIRENLVDLAISTGENIQANEEKLLNNIKSFLFDRLDDVPIEYINKLSRKILRDIAGYGEIDPLIQDDDLEEIMIIGINKPVFVYHRSYGMMKTNIRFTNEQDLLDLIDTIARQINRRIDQESPILDGRLTDGSRINATIPPISADGPSLTIRKFRKDREWDQFHSPSNLAKAISIESAELLEEFLWDNENYNKQNVQEELADVMIYCLHMADALNVDINEIINKKMDKNEKKYPINKAKGNSKKYTEL